ncbi:MAG: peptidase U32 family protein [Thermodesulfobacteriota bacterium]
MPRQSSPPELLAPAGSVAAFQQAVARGADAIYVGVPGLNARALAKDITLADFAALVAYGHERGVKVYAAMNSLVRQEELAVAAELLAILDGIGIDAVILQDLGLYRLARRGFPGLRIHASTLMTAHNSLAVQQLAAMGFARVVLAREMTIEEIRSVRSRTAVELEAFVHGAMCFSYSGLCLFSSFLGGKSGLRGRCVQPCRRRYRWAGGRGGAEGGYFLSMHDLCGLDLLPQLAAAGVGSLKIEGRMRSASYVGAVVAAYRLALDAAPGDQAALAEAKALLAEALGRKSTSGFFASPSPPEIINPGHSGNIGRFLGQVREARSGSLRLCLRLDLAVGDRVRLHQEDSGERQAFTVRDLRLDGRPVSQAPAGASVSLTATHPARPGDSLYLVDRAAGRLLGEGAGVDSAAFGRRRLEKLVDRAHLARLLAEVAAPAPSRPARRLAFWLRADGLPPGRRRLPVQTSRRIVTLTLDPGSHRLPKADPGLVIALPPVILEPQVEGYRQAVSRLLRAGQRRWQIGHIGQLQLFIGQPVEIMGDFTLNVLNSGSLHTLKDLGVGAVQASLETDRDNLAALLAANPGLAVGLTLFGRPALCTARAAPAWFRYGVPMISPKGEELVLQRRRGLVFVHSRRPLSLLAELPDLEGLGLDYGVLDLTAMGPGGEEELTQALAAKGQGLRGATTFNFRGRLL